MKKLEILMLAGLLLLTGCASAGQGAAGPEVGGYRQIDQETAKQMMEQGDGVVVDVRRLDEFESGHIPGAICIPNEEIGSVPPEELPNPAQTILIYCRSGRRSKEASEKLAAMGYTNVYEFGGIIDWTGEVAAGQALWLRVESNPTTGYSWAAEQDAELFEISTCYTAEPRAGAVSGAGGWQSFVLTPKEAGTVRVSFTYRRPWEPSEADPQIRCVFEITEDLTITVVEDGAAAAAAEHGYVPELKIY